MIEATLKEFTTYSYENASLNRIIKNAGISKGTFYYHLENKETLYLFILKTGFDAKWLFINSHAQENVTNFTNMDIFDKFLYQARMGVLFAHSYPDYHKLSRMLLKEKNNPIYEKVLTLLNDDVNDILGSMINESIIKKELNSNYDDVFIKKILGYLFEVFDDIFNKDIDSDLNMTLKNLESYIEFMKYGLKSK